MPFVQVYVTARLSHESQEQYVKLGAMCLMDHQPVNIVLRPFVVSTFLLKYSHNQFEKLSTYLAPETRFQTHQLKPERGRSNQVLLSAPSVARVNEIEHPRRSHFNQIV